MKRNIKLSLEQAKELYQGNNSKIDILLLTTFSKNELVKLPESWRELHSLDGYYVDHYSGLPEPITGATVISESQMIFPTEEMAEASVAMAQLAQLMKVYNGGNQEDWCDWKDKTQSKHCIYFSKDRLLYNELRMCSNFIAFKTRELADHFLEHHEELIMKARPLL